MSTVVRPVCEIKGRLYEEYERAALKRIAHRNGTFVLMNESKLKQVNREIAEALSQLREHERVHGCNGRAVS